MNVNAQSGTVLVVEDSFVRAFVRTFLNRHGFTVFTADAEEAVALLRSGKIRIDLLITNRPALFAGLVGNASLLYVAASPDPAETAGYSRSHLLRKPFRPEHLLNAAVSLMSGLAARG